MERLLSLPFTTWDATGPYPPTFSGNDTFPLFTALPPIPEAITSINFTVIDGPVWDDSVPPQPTTVTITVTITPKGMKQIRLTGIKTQV